jgi:hypothetical protein
MPQKLGAKEEEERKKDRLIITHQGSAWPEFGVALRIWGSFVNRQQHRTSLLSNDDMDQKLDPFQTETWPDEK